MPVSAYANATPASLRYAQISDRRRARPINNGTSAAACHSLRARCFSTLPPTTGHPRRAVASAKGRRRLRSIQHYAKTWLPLAIRVSDTRLLGMTSAPTKSTKSSSAQARWGWSGVSKLTRRDQELHVEHLAAMLLGTKSSRGEVVAQLVELRARFHGWLHQDEFGPSRGEQTAALRQLIRSVGKLCELLKKGTPRSRARLDATLRSGSVGQMAEALSVAITESHSALQHDDASGREILWFSILMAYAEAYLKQSHLVDDATESRIADTALLRHFELSRTTKRLSLAEAERWLRGYRDVLDKTLERLKVRRGAQERVSLKLLVEELCALWERETGLRATAHGIVNDVHTSRTETDAGRFVTAAVEAMLPDEAWYEAHAKFARSVRAETFLSDKPGKNHYQNARASQILVIMRGFVGRRPKPPKMRKPAK